MKEQIKVLIKTIFSVGVDNGIRHSCNRQKICPLSSWIFIQMVLVTLDRDLRIGLWLEYVTLGWNVAGSLVVVYVATRTGSAALAGFGLDSLIEIFASVVVVWQLKGIEKGREGLALKLIGAAFIALALYVLGQSALTLFLGFRPAASVIGMIWLAVTCAVMLMLAWGKLTVGRHLDNKVLKTEALVTLIDALLAGAVLVGISLNETFGWWWADPLAGLVIVYYGFKEGRNALKNGVI